uniref:Copper transport protein n=3 Tax=Mastacembelus armatus TaxID=205130 RepID=A0A7N8WUP2_9TELE
MTFEASSRVTLLFDFWNVQGPAGMVLSVFVVLLLTVFYEMLKVWRVWLGSSSKLAQRQSPHAAPPFSQGTVLNCSISESSLTTIESQPPAPDTRNRARWLLHSIQTVLHVLQVTLGYMLMLCVMSYNTWIFLGVIFGSVLGYFISFPVL